MKKINTGIKHFGYDVYFCVECGEYWFETEYTRLDTFSKDMLLFATNYLELED